MPHRVFLNQFVKNFILISVIAGAYFVFGLLGLGLSTSGNPIGLLMPSAGLALAAVLLFGKRVLVGVAIGAFCLSAWAFDFNHKLLLYFAINASGAALTASVGGILIRRIIGYPNPLLEARKIILFMFLGGVVTSAISATINISAMHSFGIIALADIPLAWVSAWMGDLLGVLIFSPLILILFAEPRPIWYRRRKTVAVPIILTFALVSLLFFYLSDLDRQNNTEQLKEKAITLAQAVKNRVQLDVYSLYGLRNFLLGAQSLETQQFLRLTKTTLVNFKEIQSIGWLSITKNEPEKRQFITMTNTGVYEEPMTWPLIPSSLREKIMANSSLSSKEYLFSENNSLKWIIPAIKRINQNTLDIIIATVSMDALIHQALEPLNTSHCLIAINTSKTTLSDAKTIYSNIGHPNFKAYQTISIPVADQIWQFNFYHDWDIEKKGNYSPIGWILFSGLWFTGVLGIVLLHLTGRFFRGEAIIVERTQSLMETKTAAELANQAKSQFLAKVSHELRTPLNGVSGFATLLEKNPSLDLEGKKQVRIIKQCSDNLLGLINDILDISAIETRQMTIEISDFNFAHLLNECMQISKFSADEKGLQLIVNNNCQATNFLGDEKRIRQILANLIDNAVKYTERGEIKVSASYENGYLKLSVADTGCGISQDDLEHIFSPFIQVNIDNFSREGIGLGLAIIKELVSLMDGEISVNSQLGMGSIFTISLPLPVSELKNTKVKRDPLSGENQMNDLSVLIVDDSEINLLFLESMLEQIGCKVETAIDGEEALELIGQFNYDLALIDINMPVMNGLELVKRLREQHIQLKLVAVSAYADNDKINEALAAGFDVYLTKPIEEQQLLELIQTVL